MEKVVYAFESTEAWDALFAHLYAKGVTAETTQSVVSDGAQGIESARGACRAPSPPQQPAGATVARRRAAQRDFGWCWTGVSGWGRVAPQGCPGVKASGRAVWKAGGQVLVRPKRVAVFAGLPASVRDVPQLLLRWQRLALLLYSAVVGLAWWVVLCAMLLRA